MKIEFEKLKPGSLSFNNIDEVISYLMRLQEAIYVALDGNNGDITNNEQIKSKNDFLYSEISKLMVNITKANIYWPKR